jgi:hypothetical protein
MMVGFGDSIDLTVGISYADGKAVLIEEHAGRMGWPSRPTSSKRPSRIRHFIPVVGPSDR